MIISRTPFRISFFGGGTDFPSWYNKHGGEVLATTINKYCYITCRYLPPFFEHRFRIAYSQIEDCLKIDDIMHPGFREVLRYLKIEQGVEIHTDADLPARGGLGSSSTFIVGLLNALYALKGRMLSKRQLAFEGIHLEQKILKETVGSQDQTCAAYGGFNHISFTQDGEVFVEPISSSKARIEELNAHLMLFFTGIKRSSSDVAKSYVENINEKEKELQNLRRLVAEGISVINDGMDIKYFGELLHEAWQLKRGLSSIVSNSLIDELYARARSAGAIGGKITGAGGGGYLLLFAPPEKHKNVISTLNKLVHIPFCFDNSGSRIIFYDP